MIPETNPNSIRLLLVGDVMLGRLVNQALKEKAAESSWGNTLPLFRAADWRACNLECVISDFGSPWRMTPKAFHFRSDAKNISVLKAARINAVSLANNHTLDFEHEAMTEMLALLDGAGIRRSGAGKNLAEASQPAVAEVAGLTIGWIAFTDNQPEWEATECDPGIFYVPIRLDDPRAKRLLDQVYELKSKVDLLLVSAHWGPNWDYRPPGSHIAFGRALIDAGADLVFGHSAHVFRGIEIYRERPILYSAGDFIDDYAVDEIERNDESFIFEVNAKRRITGLKLYPACIENFQARLADEARAVRIVKQMIRLCSELKTEAQWNSQERCLEVAAHPG